MEKRIELTPAEHEVANKAFAQFQPAHLLYIGKMQTLAMLHNLDPDKVRLSEDRKFFEVPEA